MKRIFISTFIVLLTCSTMGQTINIQPIEIEASEQATLAVSLTGATSMTALQFNLALPEGVTIAGNATLGAATNGHTLSVQTLDNGDHLYVLYSMDMNTFKDGELLRVPITIGRDAKTSEGKLYTIRTATTEAVSKICTDSSFTITIKGDTPTGIAAKQHGMDGQSPVYNLSGQRLNMQQKGLNIVDGKKVVRK